MNRREAQRFNDAALWLSLPVEVQWEIWQHLDPKSFFHLPLVCRRWNELTQPDDLWKQIHISHFGGPCKQATYRKDLKTCLGRFHQLRKQSLASTLDWAWASGHHQVLRQCIKESGAKEFRWMKGKVTQLIGQSATHGYDDVIRLLVSKPDLQLESASAKGNPLLLASAAGQDRVISYLLSEEKTRKAYLSRNTVHRCLLAAAQGGHLRSVQLLLEAPEIRHLNPDVNFSFKETPGRTPLHVAALLNRTEVPTYLLSRGAKVNARYTAGGLESQLPLRIAAHHGNDKVVGVLLSHGADVDELALFLACKKGHTATVRLLVETSVAQGRHMMEIERIDEKGMPIDHSSGLSSMEAFLEYPLYLACKTGSEELLKYLLGILDEDKAKRLSITLEELKEKRASLYKPTFGGPGSIWHPLHVAARKSHGVCVQLLLDHNIADVNSTNQGGETPLFLAAGAGDLDVLQSLIKAGASIDSNSESAHGRTPLCHAAQRGQYFVASNLLAAGASINSRTNDKGFAPLHFAAAAGNIAITMLLAEKMKAEGVGVDVKALDGRTPLFLAAKKNGLEAAKVIRYLVENGACVNSTLEGSYLTPLSVANQAGHLDLVSVLLELGARGNQAKSRKKRDERRRRKKKEN